MVLRTPPQRTRSLKKLMDLSHAVEDQRAELADDGSFAPSLSPSFLANFIRKIGTLFLAIPIFIKEI